MTRAQISLLVSGSALVVLITLITRQQADKDATPSPFPVIIYESDIQQIGAVHTDDRESSEWDRADARENDETRITLRTPEELGHYLNNRSPSYLWSKLFSQEHVPAFMVLLEDPKYVRYWAYAMVYAGWVDEQGVLESHLIHYLKTDYRDVLNDPFYGDDIWPRFTALVMLGPVAGERGIEVLETIALSTEGLYEVTGAWLSDPPRSWDDPGQLEDYIGALRGKAAYGLVLSQNQSSIAKVEELHRENVEALLAALRAHNLESPRDYEYKNLFSSDERIVRELYTSLISALATRDAIEEMGLDGYQRAIAATDTAAFEIHAYYAGTYRID